MGVPGFRGTDGVPVSKSETNGLSSSFNVFSVCWTECHPCLHSVQFDLAVNFLKTPR